MGYPVPANSPQITIGSRTVCAAAFDWSNIVGTFFKVGIYEKGGNGEWMELSAIATYTNDGDFLKDMQSKGGSVAYMKWIVSQINAAFSKLFGAAPVAASVEPTTDPAAKAYVLNALAGMRLVNANGVPTVG